MYILDYSPNHPNTTGQPDKIALRAATPTQYARAVSFCKYYFSASFPNDIELSFQDAKSFYHGNSKIFLSCFYNTITGKYELAATTQTIIKANKSFWKYDFIGLLTDYARTLDTANQDTPKTA